MLLMYADQLEVAWQHLMPVLGMWVDYGPRKGPNDAEGTLGARVADELLEREGHAWRPIA